MIFYAGTDSWIYILFGVLWIAFAIYKGSNKTAGVAKTEAKTGMGGKAPSTAPSGLEAIMGSFLSEEDVTEDIPKIPKEEAVKKTVVEPEKPVVSEERVPSITICEEQAETSTRPKVRKINIKKAVIYSEILRRPYE